LNALWGVDMRDRGSYQQSGHETWSHGDNEVSVRLGYRRPLATDVSAGTDQPPSENGLIRAGKLRRLIQASRSDARTEPSMRQLLTLELWHRSKRSMDVAA
jgi:hypothetical protein